MASEEEPCRNELRVFSREFKHRTVLRLEGGESSPGGRRGRGQAPAFVRLAGGLSGDGGCWVSRKRGRKPGWRRASVGEFPLVRCGVLFGRRLVLRQARRRARPSQGAPCRTRAAGRPAASGSAFFSRSLAALGRDQPGKRRAHLYAVIRGMIAVEPQGFLTDDATVQRLCALGGVSRAGYYRHFGPHGQARRRRLARPHPTHRTRQPLLRLSPHRPRASGARA